MKTHLIILLTLLPFVAFGQSKELVGRVYVLNQIPVQSINVQSIKSKTSAKTDSNGVFRITINQNDKLKFWGKPLNSQIVKVNVNQNDSIILQMTFAASPKTVEHLIGYGMMDEKYKTTAIQTIPSSTDYTMYTDIYELIKAKFSNVLVSENCIIVRGMNSIYGPSCALMIVDGVETNNISGIHPTQIKQISLLKDGGAAIYGSRAANGVLLIELKKGPEND